MVRGNRRAIKTMKPNDTDEGEPLAKLPRINSRIFQLPMPVFRKSSGKLLSCGQNEVGQLGLGEDVTEKTRPALVINTNNVKDICAGGMHSLYLTNDGVVFSFGCNDEGALGRDTQIEGAEYTPKQIDLPGKTIKISAGDSHSASLLDDGRVFAWGSFRDSHGNMGLTLEGNKRFPIEVVPGVKFVDIVSGADHLVLLTNTGKIYTIGCAEQGQLGRVTSRSSSGESRRGKRELLQPGLIQFKRPRPVDAIWATTYCTFFRDKNTSEVYGFGLNNYNQIGLRGITEALFVPKLTQFQNVKSIAGGAHHTLVLTNDNKCYAIGRKEYGRLGIGDVNSDPEGLTMIEVLSNKKVIQISCGESCSFAVTDNGQVYAWGFGSNSQLGTGSDEDVYVPTLLTGQQVKDKKVLGVSSGGQHTLFIVDDDNKIGNTETKTKTKPITTTTTTEPAATSSEKTNGLQQQLEEITEKSSVDPVVKQRKGRKKN